MKIHVMSADQAQRFVPKGTSALISIRNPGNRPLHPTSQFDHVIRFFFDDVTPEETRLPIFADGDPIWILFNAQDAIDIFDFAEKHQDVDHFVVHCEAGISRSAAVGCVLALWVGDEKAAASFAAEPHHPNEHVLDLMIKEWHKRR